MVIKNNRNIIMGIGIIVSFALLLFSISAYLNYQHDLKEKSRLDIDDIDTMSIEDIKQAIIEQREQQSIFHCYYLLPLFAFIGVLVGTLVYYLMSDKVIQQEHYLQKNTKIILKFLTPMERKVIETLMDNDGKVQQYELSHLPGLNKLKTHRILSNLEQKGIINKDKLGKINRIVLNKELYSVLKD